MSEEQYKLWQQLAVASFGLIFAAGATILLGVVTNIFPPSKDRER